MKKRLAQFRKLNRTPSHKWSMLRNMMSSLIEHERIVTTEAKAKELRHLADQMITLAKKGNINYNATIINNNNTTTDNSTNTKTTKKNKTAGELLHYRRMASKVVRGDWNITKLFEVLGPRYILRNGGYTRVLKLSKPRAGDNAPMAVIEYVDRPGEIRPARPPTILSTSTSTSDGNTYANNAPLLQGGGVEDALRKMGISSVDELVSKEEKKKIEAELAVGQEETEEKK